MVGEEYWEEEKDRQSGRTTDIALQALLYFERNPGATIYIRVPHKTRSGKGYLFARWLRERIIDLAQGVTMTSFPPASPPKGLPPVLPKVRFIFLGQELKHLPTVVFQDHSYNYFLKRN